MPDKSANDIPHEQYEHIERAMRHLCRVDDRALPTDVAGDIENTYGKLDSLYSRGDDE